MEQIDAWSKNRRQIEKSAMKGAINIFLVYGEGDSLLNNFFFQGEGENLMELSFSTHFYQIILFLCTEQDGKLLFAVNNSIFGPLMSSLPASSSFFFFW